MNSMEPTPAVAQAGSQASTATRSASAGTSGPPGGEGAESPINAQIPEFLQSAVVRQRLHLRVSSHPVRVEPTVMYLARQARTLGACEPTRSCKLVTALTEALTNAIVHGNLAVPSTLKSRDEGGFGRLLAQREADPRYADRTVDIEMDYDGQQCVWTITDQGAGFDVEQVLTRIDQSPEQAMVSGRGILLMRAFMDHVAWSQHGQRVRLVMRRQRGGERRNCVRVPTLVGVRAAPIDAQGQVCWQAAFDAVAMDLSREGVGLLALQPGEVNRLMIEWDDEDQPVHIPAEVCQARPLGDGMVRLACRLKHDHQTLSTSTRAEPSSRAEPSRQSDALPGGSPSAATPPSPVKTARPACPSTSTTPDPTSAPPPPADASTRDHPHWQEVIDARLRHFSAPASVARDERAGPRVTYAEPIHITLHKQPARVGVTREISRTAIAFITDFPLAPGDAVRLELHEGEQPLHVHAEIVDCRHITARFHDVAARFVE